MPSANALRIVPLLTLLGVLVALVASGCKQKAATPATPTATKLTVAAASSLRFALPEIIAEFEKTDKKTSVEAVYGSSGGLFSQIASKAPFDVFLAADETYPIELIKARHAVGGSIVRYATGRLALWVPNDSPVDVTAGFISLTHESIKKIAVANPKIAPYGAAAEEALKKSGAYDSTREKLVLAENIAQAAQFVESGSAQAALLSLSMVLSPGMKEKGRSWIVPEADHAPIIQSGCISAYAKDRASAERFMAFIQSEAARDVLRRHGFGIPGGN